MALAEIEESDPAFVYYAWEVPGGGLHEWGEEASPGNGAR